MSVWPTNEESGWIGGGGWERLLDRTQLVSGVFLKVLRVLAFALRGALDGGRLYQHLALLAPARVVRVGEFEQFNGRAVFDYERDADAVGWVVRRNQDFAASKLGGEISHFKRDVRNLPDEIRDRRVRFETHPLHAEFTFLVADDKQFQVFQVGLPGLHFGSGNSDVMVSAHCLSLSVGIGTNSTLSLLRLKRDLVAGLLRHEVKCTSLVFWRKSDSEWITAHPEVTPKRV